MIGRRLSVLTLLWPLSSTLDLIYRQYHRLCFIARRNGRACGIVNPQCGDFLVLRNSESLLFLIYSCSGPRPEETRYRVSEPGALVLNIPEIDCHRVAL